MALTVFITLTVAGTDTGPFDLYSDADGYTSAFETGVSKASLLAGYTSTLVPDAATIVRVKSNSAGCTNYVDIPITGVTTTTTTTIAYTYYFADQYDCATCTEQAINIVVALPTAASPDYGKFYVPLVNDGYVYLLGSGGAPASPLVILQDLNSTTCADACALSIVP